MELIQIDTKADVLGVSDHAVRIFIPPSIEREDGSTKTLQFDPEDFLSRPTDEGAALVSSLMRRMHMPMEGDHLNRDVRMKHICASELGAWLGICEYARADMDALGLSSTREMVLQKKKGFDTTGFQHHLDRGRREEPMVIKVLETVFKLDLVQAPMGTLTSGNLAATPDGLGSNGTFGLEIKSTSGKIVTCPPETHIAQIQGNMMCTADEPRGEPRIKRWLYCSATTGCAGTRTGNSLKGGPPAMFNVFVVPYDKDFADTIRYACSDFDPHADAVDMQICG